MGQFPDQDTLSDLVISGLAAGEFSVYYQPKFDPDSEDIVSLEALLRWRHPSEGFQKASHFIPAIERAGELVRDVDAWVLKDATRQGRQWLDEGLSFGSLNVNVSDWNGGGQLVALVRAALQESGFPAQFLALECPWRMLAVNVEAIASTMTDLRALGCTIVLDGNPLDRNCLDQVRQTPVQLSKVCIEHIEEIAKSDGAGELKARIKNWRKHGVQIVSMGVEDEDQAVLSHQAGCRFSQGNRFKSPLPADEITSFLRVIEKTRQALSLI